MIADFKILNDADIITHRRLVIWGAGSNGKEMANALKNYVKEIEFVDADAGKAGNLINGILVSLPEKLLAYQKNGKEYAIAMSTNSLQVQESILQQIEDMQIRDTDIFTWYAVQAALCAMRQSEGTSASHGDRCEQPRISEQKSIEVYHNEVEKVRNCQKLLGEMFFASVSDKAVWVYQDKKVGSCTIANSARAAGIYAVHVHTFNLLNFDPLDFGDSFIKQIIQKTSGKVISLVREPIARQVSLLWQRYGNAPTVALKAFHSWKEWEERFYAVPNEEDEFEWYIQEFLKILGINIYEYPFDREKGYTVINQDGISVLLLKMEKIDDLEQVIGDFLGEKHFKLEKNNVGGEKKYKYAYQNYLDHVRIPRGFYDHYYKDNKYMDHFYTEEEKATFAMRWKKHIVESKGDL